MRKALGLDADAVVFDLEDAVPSAEKDRARKCLRSLMDEIGDASASVGSPAVFVRINGVADDMEWEDDLQAALGPGLAGVRVPKVEDAATVQAVDARLTALEHDVGLAPGAIRLSCSLETALGVVNAREVAQAPRVELLTFGALDFLHDIEGLGDGEDDNTLVAKSLVVLAARAAGLPGPVGNVFTDLDDLEGLRASSQRLRALGFSSRSCIHPSQVPVVNEVFSPTEAEVAAAREVLALAERIEGEGRGAGTTADRRFVDRPQVERARRVVEQAGRTAAAPDRPEAP